MMIARRLRNLNLPVNLAVVVIDATIKPSRRIVPNHRLELPTIIQYQFGLAKLIPTKPKKEIANAY